jgi:hypothetical protein
MKWLVLFSILTTMAFSHNIYWDHLPSNIYQQLVQRKLIDDNEMESITDVKYGEVADIITIRVERDDRGEYVLVAYRCRQAIDNFGGMLLAYQKGEIIGAVIFDEIGRDYIIDPPYSTEKQKAMTLSILDLIEGGYMKLVENSTRE